MPPARLFVAVALTPVLFSQYTVFPDFLHVRKVSNAPGIVHIAPAADIARSDWMGAARYAPSIEAEIAVGDSDNDSENLLLDLAWHAAALIKLRGHTSLLCPAISTVSWDVVASFKDGSVVFRMLDDIPRSILLIEDESPLTTADMDWVKTNFKPALKLRGRNISRRFGLAFELAYTCNHSNSPRITLANIWVALEALFGRRDDFRGSATKKISDRIAAWIPGASSTDVQHLYDARCAAVHGRAQTQKEAVKAARDSYSILKQALTRAIETGEIPLPDEPKPTSSQANEAST